MCRSVLAGFTETVKPSVQLADLMRTHLEVEIDPVKIERFIANHWSKVSSLAHRIHNDDREKSWRQTCQDQGMSETATDTLLDHLWSEQ